MVSRHHLIAWSRNNAAEVVAIADPSVDKARRRAAEFGLALAFSDVAAMLDAIRPDCLDIAAPMTKHGELIALAAERGIAVLCQKPLAPSADEAQAIVQATSDRIRLMIHENWRFRPHYRSIRRWLTENRIGTPKAFRLETLSSALLEGADGNAAPGLVRQPFLAEMPRLVVLELLTHHLDVLGFLFGSLLVESASIARVSNQVVGEDTAMIALSAGGVAGIVFASMSARGLSARASDSLLILGTAGSIELRGETLQRRSEVTEQSVFRQLVSEQIVSEQVETEEIAVNHDVDYQASYDAAIQHFTDCLENDRPFETNPAVHRQVLEAVEAIYSAAPTGTEGSFNT